MAVQEYSILYNETTILHLQRGVFSFITLLPLKQEKDLEIASEEKKKTYQERMNKMITSLQTYDEKKNLGATYKIVSHYEKLSPLQRHMLNRETNNKDILNRKDINTTLSFDEIKLNQKIEEILNVEAYTKTDFLVVKTFIRMAKATEIFGEPLQVVLKKLDFSNIQEFKNNMNLLYTTHTSAYKSVDYESSRVPKNEEILDILGKLSLTTTKTYYKDLNNLKNNVINHSLQKDAIQYDIYLTSTSVPDIIKFNSSFISIKNENKTKFIKILAGERPYIETEEIEGKFKVEFFIEGNGTIKKVYSNLVYNLEKKQERGYIKNFVLAEMPVSFDKNMAESAKEVLKSLGFEEFNVVTEIVKKTTRIFEKQIITKKKILTGLTQLPSLSDRLYNKDIAIQHKNNQDSLLHYLGEGSQFSNVRFSISIRLDNDRTDLEDYLNQAFGPYDLLWQELNESISDISSPLPKSNYITVNAQTLLLENTEVSKLFDLSNGNSYFHGVEGYTDKDMEKVFKSNLFLKTKDEVQGMNLFINTEAMNFLIVAATGAGKSFLAINLLDGFQNVENKPLIWIIDRGGSFIDFTDIKGGINIRLDKNSNYTCMNPFSFVEVTAQLIKVGNMITDFEKVSLKENEEEIDNKEEIKVLYKEIVDYANTLNIIVLTEEEIKEISKVERELNDYLVYDNKNLTIKTEFTMTKASETVALFTELMTFMIGIPDIKSDDSLRIKLKQFIPIVFEEEILKTLHTQKGSVNKYVLTSDFKRNLKEKMMSAGKRLQGSDFDIFEGDIDSKLSPLDKFINPNDFGKLFNGKPNLDFSADLINVDFELINDEDISNLLVMALSYNFVAVMTDKRLKSKRKLILVDEAHTVLNSKSIAGISSFAYIYRVARKYSASIGLIAQSIADFYVTDAHPDKQPHYNGIVGNAKWKFILKDHSEALLDTTGFTKEVKKRVSQNKSFNFYIDSKVSGFAGMIMSDIDYAMASSSADEYELMSVFESYLNSIPKKLLLFSIFFKKDFVSNFNNSGNFIKAYNGKEDIKHNMDLLKTVFHGKEEILKANNFDIENFYKIIQEKLSKTSVDKISNDKMLKDKFIWSALLTYAIANNLTFELVNVIIKDIK